MNRIFFSIALALLVITCVAQTYRNASVIIFQNDFKQSMTKQQQPTSDFTEKYPVWLYEGQYYVSALAKINSSFSRETMRSIGVRTGTVTAKHATLRIPLELFAGEFHLPGVEYLEIAGKVNPELDRAKKDSRVDSVHMGWLLPLPITGKNVIIGITDWGFDYTHPMFYDTALTETRILAAWDQFRNQGPAPTGYDYGTIFTGSSQLLAAECDTFNIYEYATHGSHVAGIAAGSGAGTIYRGVAFDSNLLFATFLIDAAAVVDAFYWMKDVADNQGMRLVINMSWGLYYMGHLDGTSLLSQIIDDLSEEGVVFVSSAGNNGDVNFHIEKEFTTPADTMKTIIRFDSYSYYPKMWGQSVTMWGSPNDSFMISLKVFDIQYNLLAETPFYSTVSALPYIEDTLFVAGDTIIYNLTTESQNPANNRPHMRLRVNNRNTGTYRIGLFSTSEDAIVHYWNVIELTNGVGNWGNDFQSAGTGWTAGDANYGIGEPACCESLIAVASHVSEFLMGNGTLAGGQISNFSSFGPIIDGRMKPDISAPGQSICSSISSFTSMSIPAQNVVTSVNFGGRTYKFVRFSGTSMSSPHTAGVAALILEANPTLTAWEVKNIIKLTAREDNRTGVIPPEGSTRWGWGKLNALLAIYYAMNIQSVNDFSPVTVSIYPNPADDCIHISSEQYIPNQFFVFNLSGQCVFETQHHLSENDCLDISALSSGTYLIFMTDGKLWRSATFTKL